MPTPKHPPCHYCHHPLGSPGFKAWNPNLGWHTICINCRLWKATKGANITPAQAQAANA